MRDTDPQASAFFARQTQWQALREVFLSTPLSETLKWYKPCYCFKGRNIAALAGLKDHCWILFFKGALLADPQGILQKAGENSQSARVLKFTSVQQVQTLKQVLHRYVQEAIAAEQAGRKVVFAKIEDRVLPDELLQAFAHNPALQQAFAVLTPGRQRGYLLHFGQAKQSSTRSARIATCTPAILEGRGWNDAPAKAAK
jgi:uncharacterized protein YdeI (YjbR/CyaY-like superfamily)